MLQALTDPPQGGALFAPLSQFDGTLAHRCYQSLRQAILTLAVAPGERLRKQDLCAALGVSRSPLSEALARLAVEGLVDVQPQAGSFAARLSWAEIREGAFLREALELAAVDEVARTIAEPDLAALKTNLSAQAMAVAAGDRDGFYALDAAMHEAILGLTGHRRLPALSRTAWVQVDRARRLILPRPGRMAETLAEHQAIVAALAARDGAAAREATRHHLRQVLTLLEPLALSRPDLFAPR
jgi:DNA-binding GntR family transcriptional regulator